MVPSTRACSVSLTDPHAALMAHPALGELSPKVARRVAAASVIRRYPRRAVLFRTGDAPAALHFVLTGRVRVARRAESGSTVLHFEEAGGVLGEIPVFGGGPYPATASAAAPACCAVLPHSAVERLLAEEPEFARFALRRVARARSRRARAVRGAVGLQRDGTRRRLPERAGRGHAAPGTRSRDEPGGARRPPGHRARSRRALAARAVRRGSGSPRRTVALRRGRRSAVARAARPRLHDERS